MVTFRTFFLACCTIAEVLPIALHNNRSVNMERESEFDGVSNEMIRADVDTKVELRKCCHIDQVYHLGNGIQNCVNSSQSSWMSSFDHDSNSMVTIGLPGNCSGSDLMLLKPNEMAADRHFLLSSGQLILPHRFWILSPDEYCMDDFIFKNSSTLEESAIICTKRVKDFPLNVTDNLGRLQLDFLETDGGNVSGWAGKTIVHKCCDLYEVYLVNNHTCIPKEDYSTQFLEGLIENDSYFFRVGSMKCPDQTQIENFQMRASGQLQVQLDDGEMLLIHPDEYCLDDFVIMWDDELPEVITLVNYCPNSNKTLDLIPESEGADSVSEDLKQIEIDVPKCCPKGQIIAEKGCQNFKLANQEAKMEAIILRGLRNHFLAPNKTLNLVANEFSLAYEVAKTVQLEDDLVSNASWITPVFETNIDGNISFLLHYYMENFWDYKISVNPFCLDMRIYKESQDVFYRPVVLYWTSSFQVPGYLVHLHFISAAALLLTIWIYCFVPASSSAKLVASGSSRARKSRVMACTLTGRNLLCHSISLAIFFTVLALNQLGIYPSGDSGCVALGFLQYWSTMASFAWSTVYCFDYVWIFRGSFQVSDTYKFIPYSIFGWGIPTVFVSIASVAQFQSAEATGFPSSLNPNIGLIRCWFSDEITSLLFYLYGPMGFLLSLNVVFFISLLLNPNLTSCYKKKSSGPRLRTNRTKEDASSIQKYKDDIKMALKLFFITGIPWIFEVVNWIFTVTGHSSSNVLFDVANLCNSLRGVIIFIVFVLLQRNVRLHLQLGIRKYLSILTKKRADLQSQSIDSLSQGNTESVNTESFNSISNSDVPSTSPTTPNDHIEPVNASPNETSSS